MQSSPSATEEVVPTPSHVSSTPVVLVVLAVGVVAALGAWILGVGSDGGLGEFDPDDLDWQTHEDAAGRFTVDVPGPPEIRPATDDDVETVVVQGPVWTAVAARETGPNTVVVDVATFTAGLPEQLHQLFGIDGVVVGDHGDEPLLDGEAMYAEFEGVIDGTDVTGIVDVRFRSVLVSVVTSVGIREERADVQNAHGRVVGGFRPMR